MDAEATGSASGPDELLNTPVYYFDEPCPYLPGRAARLQGFTARRVPDSFYRHLLDHSFRRSGRLFYAPACVGCAECQPLRVRPDRFAPSRSQRRCWNRNSDLTVEVGPPNLTDEKWRLYADYQAQKHGRTDEKDVGTLQEFLYNPVVTSMEFSYRDPVGKLVAVGICDMLDDALSSVYCYYDVSQHRRGLGTYAALYELQYAKQHGLRYYYIGYYVRDCQAMRYKASYRPCEVLGGEGVWRESCQQDTCEQSQGTRLDVP